MEGTDSAIQVATIVKMGRESDRETVGRGYPEDRWVLRLAIACPLWSCESYPRQRLGRSKRLWYTSRNINPHTLMFSGGERKQACYLLTESSE
jgi:hypothetical protein